MPIKRMLDSAAFDPAAVTALTNAYEAACASLRLIDPGVQKYRKSLR